MKNIKFERNYGELLLRNNSKKYKLVEKDEKYITISIPDNEAHLYTRIGGVYKVIEPKAETAEVSE